MIITQRSCQAKNKGRVFQGEAVLKEKFNDGNKLGEFMEPGEMVWRTRQDRTGSGRGICQL